MKLTNARCCLVVGLLALMGPAIEGNILENGGFESFKEGDNLWDGVDRFQYLAGARGSARALTEEGDLKQIEMPISVQVADLNFDTLPDLLTIDLHGYFRVYFNHGTKSEPRFTHCEMIPLFLSDGALRSMRQVFKGALFDLNGDGPLDLILGDYGGEVMILQNKGSVHVPSFPQPADINLSVVNTMATGRLWGNLFAPAVMDWDRDGKPDLLLGEGSYSANSIHVLLNQGTGAAPRFSERGHFYAAFGDGHEQLVPTIVDYNGDGLSDLLVADRTGTINLYLSHQQWKRESSLEFSTTIPLGTLKKFDGCVAPAAADLNGDGLFDLVIGKPNGRISVAYNQGDRRNPAFGAPSEIKGVDVWNDSTLRTPDAFSTSFQEEGGNIYGYLTVVSEVDDAAAAPIPEGHNVLKAGYHPPLNNIIKYATPVFPARIGTKQRHDFDADSNTFVVRQVLKVNEILPGKKYTLSFRVKGRHVTSSRWTVLCTGRAIRSEKEIASRSERGGVKFRRNEVSEESFQRGVFAVNSEWSTVSVSFPIHFLKPELNRPDSFKGVERPNYSAMLDIRFNLGPGQGVCYLDDLRLVSQ